MKIRSHEALYGLGFVLFGLVSACLSPSARSITPCTVSAVTFQVPVDRIDKVDVLFMVDNSNSMSEEQQKLEAQFPQLITVLTTGDLDGDGAPNFPAVRDLHVAVVSSDMGAGGFRQGSGSHAQCGTRFGDDGIMQTLGRSEGCEAGYPSFLGFEPSSFGTVDARNMGISDFAHDFSCVAHLGDDGCGYEQQLESVLKALTPSTCTDPWCTFSGGTTGHGDEENAGFLRDDSLLAVILVTDEDDCSAADDDLFKPTGSRYSGKANVRCAFNPNALHNIDRYVDGLLALRPGHPERLVFGAITGVPQSLSSDTGTNFDEILDSPLMEEQETTTAFGPALVPSCTADDGSGSAAPPKRIVNVAKALNSEEKGSSAVVQSICLNDFRPALRVIADKIGDVLSNICLPRALLRSSDKMVTCQVTETLPTSGANTHCADLSAKGRSYLRTTDGHEVCTIAQVPSSASGPLDRTALGWYYDDSASVLETCPDAPRRVSFVEGAAPVSGAVLELNCLEPTTNVLPRGTGSAVVGTSCETEEDCAGGPNAMHCDLQSATCQLACDSDDDCPASLACAPDPGICVNPICGQ